MGRPRRTDETSRELRREIERGRFQGTSILPGERQLAALLQVSRTTVRRALADLIEDGLISQRHGMGTFVMTSGSESRPPGSDKIPVNGPLDYYGLNGRVSAIVEIRRTQGDPSPDEVVAFGLDEGEEVMHIVRLMRRGPAVDALEHWCAPARLLPDLAAIGPDLAAAVAGTGMPIARRLRRLRVARLDTEAAGHLGVEAGAPAVRLDEHHFSADGRPCLLNRAFYPADRFDAVFR